MLILVKFRDYTPLEYDNYANLESKGSYCSSCGVHCEQVGLVVETGYENILLVWLLLKIKVPHVRKSLVR